MNDDLQILTEDEKNHFSYGTIQLVNDLWHGDASNAQVISAAEQIILSGIFISLAAAGVTPSIHNRDVGTKVLQLLAELLKDEMKVQAESN